jgi:transposase-like protein
LLYFYEVKLFPEERRGLDAEEVQKAQEALWRKLRPTDLIERAFRKARRRIRPMGTSNNRSSVERIMFAVFYYQNYEEQEAAPLLFTQTTY